MSEKEEKIELEGEVTEALPNTMFRVRLENDHNVLRISPGRCGATTSASFRAIASRSSSRRTTSTAGASSTATSSASASPQRVAWRAWLPWDSWDAPFAAARWARRATSSPPALRLRPQATIDLVVRTRGRAIMAAVDVERLRHPQLSEREFTEWLVARKTHVVTSAGATSALPGVFPIVGATAEISAALADAAFLIYEQVTLILEIAHVHGRDLRDVEPRTLDVILVLALDAGVAVPRGKDIEVLGERVSASVIPRTRSRRSTGASACRWPAAWLSAGPTSSCAGRSRSASGSSWPRSSTIVPCARRAGQRSATSSSGNYPAVRVGA